MIVGGLHRLCIDYANYVATFFQSKHAEELSAKRLLNEKEKKQLETKIQKE